MNLREFHTAWSGWIREKERRGSGRKKGSQSSDDRMMMIRSTSSSIGRGENYGRNVQAVNARTYGGDICLSSQMSIQLFQPVLEVQLLLLQLKFCSCMWWSGRFALSSPLSFSLKLFFPAKWFGSLVHLRYILLLSHNGCLILSI